MNSPHLYIFYFICVCVLRFYLRPPSYQISSTQFSIVNCSHLAVHKISKNSCLIELCTLCQVKEVGFRKPNTAWSHLGVEYKAVRLEKKIEWQLPRAVGRQRYADVGNQLILTNCWKILANKAPLAQKAAELGICKVSPFLSPLLIQFSSPIFCYW